MNRHAHIDDYSISRQLERVSRRFGLPINTAEMLSVLRANAAIAVAPAQGLEEVPATALREGVDIGLAYLDLPYPELAPGYYRINVTGEATDVGETTGRARFVDDRGNAGLEVPVTIDVRSLDVPSEPRFPDTILTAEIRAAPENPTVNVVIAFCWICPNGWIVCAVLFWSPIQ